MVRIHKIVPADARKTHVPLALEDGQIEDPRSDAAPMRIGVTEARHTDAVVRDPLFTGTLIVLGQEIAGTVEAVGWAVTNP